MVACPRRCQEAHVCRAQHVSCPVREWHTSAAASRGGVARMDGARGRVGLRGRVVLPWAARWGGCIARRGRRAVGPLGSRARAARLWGCKARAAGGGRRAGEVATWLQGHMFYAATTYPPACDHRMYMHPHTKIF